MHSKYKDENRKTKTKPYNRKEKKELRRKRMSKREGKIQTSVESKLNGVFSICQCMHQVHPGCLQFWKIQHITWVCHDQIVGMFTAI